MERGKLVIGCVLLVISLGLFSGQCSAGAGQAAADGSAPPAGAEKKPVPQIGDRDESLSKAEQIKHVLASPLKATGLDVTETPLRQLVDILQDEYGISIVLDKAALTDAGLSIEEPITINLHNISLKSALRLMLRQHQLTWIVEDEVLLITTPEQAETHLVTCVYDVRDLTNGGSDAEELEKLIDAITSCVATESWAENGGGQAQIRTLKPGMMVISQTQPRQDEIRGMLDELRKLVGQTGSTAESAGE